MVVQGHASAVRPAVVRTSAAVVVHVVGACGVEVAVDAGDVEHAIDLAGAAGDGLAADDEQGDVLTTARTRSCCTSC